MRACAADGPHAAWGFGRAPKDSSKEGGEEGSMSAVQQEPSSSEVYCRNIARLCRVRKSGYHTGTVGKVYTFDVWFPDGLNPDMIRVDVLPMAEEVGEFLLDDERSYGNVTDSTTDVLSGMPEEELRMNEGPSQLPEQMDESTDQKQLRLAEEDSSNDTEGRCFLIPTSSGERGNGNIENDVETKTTGLPVVRSLENGRLRVSFCPAFVGRYQASVAFGKADVEGSPMVVSVSPDFGAQSSLDETALRKRLTFAEAAEIIIAKARSSRIYRQLLQNERPPLQNSLYAVAAAVLRRTSKVKRTVAFRGNRSQSIINSEKAVVKRRTVLKQMITRGGQEIVIERASTSIDESTNWAAAVNSVSLGVSGSSELSSVPVSAYPSYRMEHRVTEGGERNAIDGKPKSYLMVPRSDDAVFHCSPLSSIIEKPQRGDLFETEDIAWRPSEEPDRSCMTSPGHLHTTEHLENQDEIIQNSEDACKDGEPASSRSTAQSAIEVAKDNEAATDTSALRNRRDEEDNLNSDEQADYLALAIPVPEADAKSRRNQFQMSSVKESFLAKQDRKPTLDVPDEVFLLGSDPLGDNIENRWQGHPRSSSFDRGQTEEPLRSFSFDRIVSNQTEDCVDDFSKDRLILLPTKHLERDTGSKDHATTDNNVLKTFSTSSSSRKGSLSRQGAVQSMGSDVQNAVVLPQQEGNKSSGTDEEEESRSREPAEVESRPQSAKSKEPWTNSTQSLPFLLMVDRWTQVKYEEIKEETGWKRPVRRVSPRKRTHGVAQETKPIPNDGIERASSFKGPGKK